MTNNISLHQSAIANILSAVASLKTTYATAPVNLSTAQLPALYVFTGATVDEYDVESNWVDVTRDYRVQVAVLPVSLGNPAKREEVCRPIIEAIKKELRKYPSLATAGVQTSRVLGDSGIVILPEWGYKYIGFEVTLRVSYYIAREYAQGE